MEQLKFYEYLLPSLKYLSDGKEHQRNQIIDNVAIMCKLTPELMTETISTGNLKYENRIGWALTYLKQSGLITSPKKARFIISKLGLDLLATNPSSLTVEDLFKYDGYQEFINRKKPLKEDSEDIIVVTENNITPDEMIENASNEIKQTVCSDLLDSARSITPNAFENLVIDLIKKMGYGDENDPMATLRVGGSGDGGIDGIIKQDRLGLDTIYIQAKRYKEGNNVSPHDVRDFIGAVSTVGKGSKKGIFITASSFTKEAIETANTIQEPKIILIDGIKLSELMYDNGIGVSNKKIITIKKIDSDYFE